MEVHYTPEVERLSELMPRLRGFSADLNRVVGPKSGADLRAEWSLATDLEANRLVRLSLSDGVDTVSEDFTPVMLDVPIYMSA